MCEDYKKESFSIVNFVVINVLCSACRKCPSASCLDVWLLCGWSRGAVSLFFGVEKIAFFEDFSQRFFVVDNVPQIL